MPKTFEIATQKELAAAYMEIVKELKKGRAVKVSITSVEMKTKEQLGYYWDVILPRVQAKFREDGSIVSLDFINEFFNDMFFYDEHIILGRAIKKVRSKADASVDEMSQFIDNVIRWCAENGVYIPEPEKAAQFI